MKLYIPVKVKGVDIEALMEKVKIEGKFGIVTTVQYLDDVNKLKDKYLVLGQVLGCNANCALNADVDAYLYIGTGLFHPTNLAYIVDKPVYILDPVQGIFYKLDEKYKDKYEKRKKGMLLRYLQAKKIGIIVSIKSGQNQMNKALAFREKCGKEAYVFLCNNVQNLENYNDIECWVNTACVRIFEDDFHMPMVNLRDVESLE